LPEMVACGLTPVRYSRDPTRSLLGLVDYYRTVVSSEIFTALDNHVLISFTGGPKHGREQKAKTLDIDKITSAGSTKVQEEEGPVGVR